jgi:hypothetical protein
MRCQWGKTWDNMKPWLVARRFREFDLLNDLVSVICQYCNFDYFFYCFIRLYAAYVHTLYIPCIHAYILTICIFVILFA